MSRRIAITGIGLVTALGSSRERSWTALVAGECGMTPLTLFASEGYRSRVAGQVAMTDIDRGFTPLERRRLSRSDRFGVVAAQEAIDDAGLLHGVDRTRVGVLLGAGTSDLLRNERYYHTAMTRGFDKARPSEAWNHFANTPVDIIASRFGFEGVRSCVVAACSSSTIAIGQAADAIRSGRIDVALTGGTDGLAQLTFSGFNALRLMDSEPCRPFDRARAGMNMGEGAAILVLEEMSRARSRGARIYGELAGYSFACEAFHPTAPEPDGRPVSAVVAEALRDARLDASAVDHVNAHGTATPQNDRAEARGLRTVLGDRASRVPVTALKSMIGHCLGAAGGLEAAVLALTVSRGVIPPTINHGETDPDCPVDIVANTAREQPVRCGVSTSLGFGGNDSAVVITAV
jgi:3-oxoacyl-[acyl-carrier-protein] synthase II